jgi:hypothetical protein
MQLYGNDYQLLGFMELNGPDLYDTVGNQYGKLSTYIELKFLIGCHNRDAVNFPRRLSQSDSPNERSGHRER